MLGTFGGALEARGIPAGEGYLAADVLGEIEKEDKVLVVKRIHVTYHLKAEADRRSTAERVLGFHAEACPLARSISSCVTITTSLQFEAL